MTFKRNKLIISCGFKDTNFYYVNYLHYSIGKFEIYGFGEDRVREL
jgi:hypothetical protein